MDGVSEASTELAETSRPQERQAPQTLDDLFGNLTSDIRKTGNQLAGLKSQEIDEKSRVFANMEGRMEGDRTIAKRHFDAAGIEVDKLQPWNAQQEYAKVSHSPMEAFGSFGSLFAIAASAFTRAPMTNALSASAAAMNAIKKGDDAAYERNFSGWKDNMALVKHRFDMQQGLYRDALDLMQHDMSAGRAKLQNVLERFGDERKLLLLESGHDKDLIDMFNSELKAMEGMKKFGEEEMERGMRRQAFEGLQQDFIQRNGREPNAQEKVQIWDYAHGVSKPYQQNIVNDYRMNHLGEPDAERKTADFARGITARSDFAQAYERFKADKKAQTGEDPTPEEDIQFHQQWQLKNSPGGAGAKTTEAERYINEHIGAWQEANPDKSRRDGERALRQEFTSDKRAPAAGGAGANLTVDRQIAQDVARKREEWKNEGFTDDEIAEKAARESKRLKMMATAPTANRRDQMASTIDRFQFAENTINKVEALLKKHNALTGLGGRITRPGEVLSNWFGSNQTDRAQFRSYIEELREWAPRLLNESTSRPLSAEESRVAAIVPGLNMGDTTVNTAKRLLEVQKLFGLMRKRMTERYQGEWNAPPPQGTSTAPTRGARPWENDPIKE